MVSTRMDVVEIMGNEKKIRVPRGWSGSFSVLVDCTQPMLDMPLIDTFTGRLSEYRAHVMCHADISEVLDKGLVDLEFSVAFYLVSDFQFEFDQPSDSLDSENIPSSRVLTGTAPAQVFGVNTRVFYPCTIQRDQILLNDIFVKYGGLLQEFDNNGRPKDKFPFLDWGSCFTITRVMQINSRHISYK